jgi:hypothetical protein
MDHDPWDSISGDKKIPDWVVDEDEDEALAYDRRLLTRLGEWSPIKPEAYCTRLACAICRKDPGQVGDNERAPRRQGQLEKQRKRFTVIIRYLKQSKQSKSTL